MTRAPDPETVDAWTSLLRAHNAALGRIEAALKRAGLPPLAWYDVLWELEQAGDGGLRPFELERRLLLPQYGLSRLTDRIAREGCLEKRPCAEDGRGQVLALTPSGRALRRDMWKVYGPAIEDAVGRRLPAGEAARLAALLSRLWD